MYCTLQHWFWYHDTNTHCGRFHIKHIQYVITVHPIPLKKTKKKSCNWQVSLEMLPQQLISAQFFRGISKYLTLWCRIPLEKLTVAQLDKKLHVGFTEHEVHYHAHDKPQLVTILSHMDPVYTLYSYVFKININIILPSTLRWVSCILVSHQNPACISLLSQVCFMPPPYHTPWIHQWSSQSYFVKTTNHEVTHPAVLSILLVLPLRSKYSLQYPVLKHPRFVSFNHCEKPSFTSIQTTGKCMVYTI